MYGAESTQLGGMRFVLNFMKMSTCEFTR